MSKEAEGEPAFLLLIRSTWPGEVGYFAVEGMKTYLWVIGTWTELICLRPNHSLQFISVNKELRSGDGKGISKIGPC